MLLISSHTSSPTEGSTTERGELFSLLLRLHPREPGQVSPGAGNHVQAAFLDMVRQGDPALSDWLHTPNQRRPYTVGFLQGFNHLTAMQLEDARTRQQAIPVQPEQTYWLRITMLDASIFSTFARYLISNPGGVTVRIGTANFSISRLLSTPEPDSRQNSWVAYTTFADLRTQYPPQKQYTFEFATPTAFSMGQRQWGKMLHLFPTPGIVFESLAKQWELFAPTSLRMEKQGITPRMFAAWCDEQIIVTNYTLATSHVPSSKFGLTGFQGSVTYEVKSIPTAPEVQWVASLARFALFSGIGYKTTMGMGQARCTNLIEQSTSAENLPEREE
jgi:CRISPR-associated endoribonuclease Cas6